MKKALILLKSANNRQANEDCAWQSSQLTMFCIANNVKPIGCVVSHAGIKDMEKRIKSSDRTKRFEYIVIYSPNQIAKSKEEYEWFINTMAEDFQVQGIPFRQIVGY